MADFYADMADIAAELLDEFGVSVPVTREVRAAYSPSAGSAADLAPQTFTMTVAIFDYPHKMIDGTSILREDKMVYAEAIHVGGAKVGDILAIGAKRLKVVNVKPLQPALVAVLYELQVREVTG